MSETVWAIVDTFTPHSTYTVPIVIVMFPMPKRGSKSMMICCKTGSLVSQVARSSPIIKTVDVTSKDVMDRTGRISERISVRWAAQCKRGTSLASGELRDISAHGAFFTLVQRKAQPPGGRAIRAIANGVRATCGHESRDRERRKLRPPPKAHP